MEKLHDFKVGQQVAYIPNHADDIDHEDVEYGFVTRVTEGTITIWVRFWVKGKEGIELRTKANSEPCYPATLRHHDSCTQYKVDEAMKVIAAGDRDRS